MGTLNEQGDKTANLLVVDDDADTRNVIVRMLRPLGVNIAEAPSGRQALGILKKQRVDVVVSDLIMPRMSGMMLLHSMMEQGYHIPVILATGYGDKDSAIQALRLGAFDYLEKPLDETDLQSVVGEALRVSNEQRRLLTLIESRPEGRPKHDSHAELLIMKMRAFRHQPDQPSQTPPRADSGSMSWLDLKDMFANEAEPQLIFCGGSLKGLPGASPARELSYALRVIQSVRLAAEALRIGDVAELAWSLETGLVWLKTRPSELTQERVDLLMSANKLLIERVVTLGRAETRTVQERLAALSEELKKSS